jgi:uncharacterized DUF497 family protein
LIYYWTEKNREHIGEHDVSCEEAEYVVDNARPPYPRAIGEEKFQVWGRTESGRYLQVIFVFPADEEIDPALLTVADRIRFSEDEDDVVYILHARDLTEKEKRAYRKRSRGRP